MTAPNAVIPESINNATPYNDRAPIAPVGWNELVVTDVLAKEGKGKPIQEVVFSNPNGFEAKRAFFLTTDAIGFYLGFLTLIAPEEAPYGGKAALAILKGKRVRGLVAHSTDNYVKKNGEAAQITNANVEAFAKPVGEFAASATSAGGNGASAAPATPPPTEANDLPF